jgi:drug/metabolite transporter (DMT)-like permease
MNAKQKAYLALAVICIFWGATWVVSRHAIVIGKIPALQLCAIRQLLAGAFFCIFFFTKGVYFPPKKDWKKLLALSFLLFVCSNGLSTLAVKTVGSGLSAIIGAITSLWLAVFGFTILKQRISVKTFLGLLLGFSGVLIIFYDHLNDFTNSGFTIGIMLAITATVTWALGTTFTVKFSKFGNAYYNIGWQMLISGCILYALSYTQPRIQWSAVNIQGWIDIAILVLFGSVVPFIAYMYLLNKLPAAQVSVYVYINPIIAVILSHWVFNEKISTTLGIGALIILTGVYIVNNSVKIKD